MSATLWTLLALAWPFIISAVAWGIAVWALRLPDEQSILVGGLTTPKAARAEPARASAEAASANPSFPINPNNNHGDHASC